MQGLWLSKERLSFRDDLERPEPPPGEALVRVVRAGICATDHGLVAGLYPFEGILGHEFTGVVEDGPEELRGKRVAGEINAACGRCAMCVRGLRRHCSERTVLGIAGRNGAFAEYLSLPAENLHVVPEGVSTEAAIFTEPLAAALEILEQGAVRPDDRVLLAGDGKLGQLVAQVLALTGCELLVAGRHPRKLRLLEERGIRTTLAADVPRGAFDVAVECTGNASGFELARAALRPRGTLVLKSTYPGKPEIDATMLVVDEITLLGSRCGPFAPALRLLEEGRIDVSYLEDATYPLRDGLAAFERSRDREVLKVTIAME